MSRFYIYIKQIKQTKQLIKEANKQHIFLTQAGPPNPGLLKSNQNRDLKFFFSFKTYYYLKICGGIRNQIRFFFVSHARAPLLFCVRDPLTKKKEVKISQFCDWIYAREYIYIEYP